MSGRYKPRSRQELELRLLAFGCRVYHNAIPIIRYLSAINDFFYPLNGNLNVKFQDTVYNSIKIFIVAEKAIKRLQKFTEIVFSSKPFEASDEFELYDKNHNPEFFHADVSFCE